MVVIDILQIYWYMLFGSLIISLALFFIGDVISDFIDGIFDGLFGDFLNPLLIFSTTGVIGGTGVLLTKYTEMNDFYVLMIALFVGLISYFLIYYFLVVPISQAETSTGYSMMDLEGKTAEVTITIPKDGLGEILISSTNSSSNQIAKSIDEVDIAQGTRVVVVKVEDDIVYVSSLEEEL